MNLTQFPRRLYTEYKTPVQKLNHFSKKLNGPNIFVKRDDLLGLTAGGNKTRKLEFLMADALSKKADTIITCGAIQSNHCRLTLAAAVKEGLKCVLVLEELVPNTYDPKANGNIFLYHLLGAEIIVVPKGTDMNKEMEKVAEMVNERGENPYIIPLGGSNEIGALGYAVCAEEIIQQTRDAGVAIDYIVVASGSGGTHAGLIAGLYNLGVTIPILGISVSKQEEVLTELVYELMVKTTELAGMPEEIPRDLIKCFDSYVGEGYALPTEEMVESVQMLSRTEGILLDPVYTGKVMAGLIDLARNNYFQKDDNVLFIHTGGLPTLFANTDLVLKD